MSTTKTKKARLKVWSWVSFPYSSGKSFAQIIEDRGPLGIKGRRIYRIRFEIEGTEDDSFEVSEDDVEPVPPPDKETLIKYLKENLGTTFKIKNGVASNKRKIKAIA